jgi:hypothetical protein
LIVSLPDDEHATQSAVFENLESMFPRGSLDVGALIVVKTLPDLERDDLLHFAQRDRCRLPFE